MNTDILVLATAALLSGIALCFSIHYTASRLNSGKILAHSKQGNGRTAKRTYSRAHDPINYWFFLALYSVLLNGPIGAIFYVSLNNLLTQMQL